MLFTFHLKKAKSFKELNVSVPKPPYIKEVKNNNLEKYRRLQ